MPGEAADFVRQYQDDLRKVDGRSSAEVADAIAVALGELAHKNAQGEVSRQGLDTAIGEIRSELRAVKVAVNEERKRHRPSAPESEAIDGYADFDAEELRRSDVADIRKGHRLDGLVKAESHGKRAWLGGEGEPIRMFTWTDEFGETHPGYLDDPTPRSAGQVRAQRLAGIVATCRALGVDPRRSSRRLVRHMRRLDPRFARMFSDNAGEGAEWIPDRPGTTLLSYMQMPRVVLSRFGLVPIEGNKLTNPFWTKGLQGFIVGKPTAGDVDPATLRQSVGTTSDLAYTTVTLGVSTVADQDATEDSIIAFFPVMDGAIAQCLTDMREDAALNGDTTPTHADTGILSDGWLADGRWTVSGGSDDHRRSVIGVRHRALSDSATVSATTAKASTDLFQLRGKLTKGYSLSDLAFFCSLEYLIYHALPDANLLTVDKYGAAATVVTGEVGRIGGVPIIPSEFYSAELTAAGIYDGVTKSKTGGTLVVASKIKRPIARAPRVVAEQVARKHVTYITGTDREGLTYECTSTETPCASLIDASSDGS